MNPVNKVRYNNGILEDLCFNKDRISVGVSSDYMVNDAYAESCNTGWYQSKDATGRYTYISEKSPGGSIFISGGEKIEYQGAESIALGTNDFTIEFWFYTSGSTSYPDAPFLCNQLSTDTEGFRISLPFDGTNSEVRVSLGSAGGSWDICNDQLIASSLSANTWYHICLSRKNESFNCSVNGVWSNSIPSSPFSIFSAASFYIGGYKDGTGLLKNFYFTNLRFLIGFSKYDLNTNFTPPTYPISAIGQTGSTFNTPFLLNVFQSSKRLFNQGTQKRTITETGGSSEFSNLTPFLYPIPKLYRWSQSGGESAFINNLSNIARSDFGEGPFTTAKQVTDWYRSKNNIFINNFDYEDIPTDGLTYLYDTGHIMSNPLTANFIGLTNSSLFNLVNNTTSVLNIVSPSNSRNKEIYTNPDYFSIMGLSTDTGFTMVVVFKRESTTFSSTTSVVGTTGNTNNGFKIKPNTIGSKALDFYLYDKNGNQYLIYQTEDYTLSAYTMFTMSSNGLGTGFDPQTKIYKNKTLLVTDTTTSANRLPDTLNILFDGTSPQGNQYKFFCFYNKYLEDSQVTRLYDAIKSRLSIL